MSERDQRSKDGDDLTPLSKFREWKFLYFEPGRPGLEDGTECLGLCKYCGILETCTLPRPESGVWRCSHYVPGTMRTALPRKLKNFR